MRKTEERQKPIGGRKLRVSYFRMILLTSFLRKRYGEKRAGRKHDVTWEGRDLLTWRFGLAGHRKVGGRLKDEEGSLLKGGLERRLRRYHLNLNLLRGGPGSCVRGSAQAWRKRQGKFRRKMGRMGRKKKLFQGGIHERR